MQRVTAEVVKKIPSRTPFGKDPPPEGGGLLKSPEINFLGWTAEVVYDYRSDWTYLIGIAGT